MVNHEASAVPTVERRGEKNRRVSLLFVVLCCIAVLGTYTSLLGTEKAARAVVAPSLEVSDILLSIPPDANREEARVVGIGGVPETEERSGILVVRERTCEPSRIQMENALSCLRLTNASLVLEYPEDAMAHFDEIREALRPWSTNVKMHCYAGYCGPWIENIWIDRFGGESGIGKTSAGSGSNNNSSSSSCLSDTFGPFIPILFPWVDFWLRSRKKYPEKMMSTLKSILRQNVPYVTVSQSDEGLAPCQLLMRDIPNILVLSAGGYGHVPIPLLKQEEAINNLTPMKNRTRLISYVGSLGNAPRGMRKLMSRTLERRLRGDYTYFQGDLWREIMADSRFSLAPRGFGRTSFHMFETLQMGLIPIHVYTDVPWIPYANILRNISFSSSVGTLSALLAELQKMSKQDLESIEEQILSLRDTHFKSVGAMHQIELFLNGGGSDLVCQKLPDSVRDSPKKSC